MEPVLCAPKAVIKMLMTTVMKTKVVAALLSWFRRHWFSTLFRFSLAVETRRSGWVDKGQSSRAGTRSFPLPTHEFGDQQEEIITGLKCVWVSWPAYEVFTVCVIERELGTKPSKREVCLQYK